MNVLCKKIIKISFSWACFSHELGEVDDKYVRVENNSPFSSPNKPFFFLLINKIDERMYYRHINDNIRIK